MNTGTETPKRWFAILIENNMRQSWEAAAQSNWNTIEFDQWFMSTLQLSAFSHGSKQLSEEKLFKIVMNMDDDWIQRMIW